MWLNTARLENETKTHLLDISHYPVLFKET
jgi:hypothetical protein